MIYQLKVMSPKHKLLILCILLVLTASCESKTPCCCNNKLNEVCDFGSKFGEMDRLSIEKLISLAKTNSWEISSGEEDTDSVFLKDGNNRMIFESKINEFKNIHGYGKFYPPDSECIILAYFLNGDRIGPLTKKDNFIEGYFQYTFSTSSKEILFSYVQCGVCTEVKNNDEINSMLIMYDGTIPLVQWVPFEINIYVPAPPGTYPTLESSLDSLFRNPNVHEAHPSIRELFTPEILAESTGTADIYYRYTLYNESDSILYREVVSLELLVGSPDFSIDALTHTLDN